MADNTQNTLMAAIKALEQVIAPALDTSDPLASEQLRLVIGTLKVLGSRMDHLAARQEHEFQHHLRMGHALLGDARAVSPEIADRLEAALAEAAQLQAHGRPAPADKRRVTAALASPLSALAREAAAAPEEIRRRIEQHIVAGSREWVDMQRAWFLPHGFELRPSELPALDHLFFDRTHPPKETT
jgi:hypothetical protein